MSKEKLPQSNESVSPTKKILLADDDASIRRFLEIILQRNDYEVTTAEDGLAAMSIAVSGNFDVVIADAVMPNLTGFDLCRILKQNPQYKNVPLIILSGMENDGANSADGLAEAYLLKGENLKEKLVETLSQLLADRVSS